MGLGKTLQTIGLVHTVMKNFPEQVRTVLILCPVNTIKNWVEEFSKWLTEEMMDDIQEVHDGSLGKDSYERADRLKFWMKNGKIFFIRSLYYFSIVFNTCKLVRGLIENFLF
jgi:transcriptional regulator ATRX